MILLINSNQGVFMSTDPSLQLYNKILNSIYWTQVSPILIESFVEFYKEENRAKIQNLFERVILIWSDHIRRMTEEERKDRLISAEEKEKIMIEKLLPVLKKESDLNLFDLTPKRVFQVLSHHKSVTLEDFMNAKRAILEKEYYHSVSRLMDQLDDEEPIVTGTNMSKEVDAKIMTTILKKVEKSKGKENLDTTIQGLAILGVDFISLILLYGYGLPIHTIIHEMNHLLSRETLASQENHQLNIMSFGITNLYPTDWIYEIINDYMADEIEKIFNRRLEESGFLLCSYVFADSSEHKCIYPKVDRISNHIIQNFYESSKELCKDCLIKGEGRRIYKIIEPELYERLTQSFAHIAKVIQEESGTYFCLDERFSDRLLSDSALLREHLEAYYQYEEVMKEYRKKPLKTYK